MEKKRHFDSSVSNYVYMFFILHINLSFLQPMVWQQSKFKFLSFSEINWCTYMYPQQRNGKLFVMNKKTKLVFYKRSCLRRNVKSMLIKTRYLAQMWYFDKSLNNQDSSPKFSWIDHFYVHQIGPQKALVFSSVDPKSLDRPFLQSANVPKKRLDYSFS